MGVGVAAGRQADEPHVLTHTALAAHAIIARNGPAGRRAAALAATTSDAASASTAAPARRASHFKAYEEPSARCVVIGAARARARTRHSGPRRRRRR